MFYLRLFIGADEAVSSTSRPEEFSSPHTNMYFTNVLFPEPPMFTLNSWNSDLFFDKSTTEYSSKLSSLHLYFLFHFLLITILKWCLRYYTIMILSNMYIHLKNQLRMSPDILRIIDKIDKLVYTFIRICILSL